MFCMKCGREISEEQVFCPECLAVMENYPVKPDAVVRIYPRPSKSQEKKHRELPLREQVSQLRRTVRWLMLTAAVLAVALLLTAAMLLHQLDQPTVPTNLPLGRNYTTSQQES